jgi:hypothetical protein
VSPFYFVIPYAHVFLFAVLAACSLAGLAMVFHGRRPGRRKWMVAGGLVVGFCVYVVLINLEAHRKVIWRPTVAGTAPLVGRWSGDGSALTLSADGQYHCDGQGLCHVLMSDGRWTRDRESTYITLWPPAESPRRYNILSYRGHLRLTDFVVDPDEWDGRFVFSRTDSAGR